MNNARGYHTATKLDDGRILVVGGLSSSANFSFTNEIWDNGVWTETRDPSLGGEVGGGMVVLGSDGNQYYVGRYGHTATKMANGKVLIVGGKGFEGKFDNNGGIVISELSSAFIFDPATNTFEATVGQLSAPRRGHYAIALEDGRVVIAGGYNSNINSGQGSTLPFVEIFDLASGTFTELNSYMDTPREGSTAHLLNDGDIMFTGGFMLAAMAPNPTVAQYMAPGFEIYNLVNGSNSSSELNGGVRRFQSHVTLGNGDFYLFGGDNGRNAIDTITRFNSETRMFENAGSLETSRHLSKAVFMDRYRCSRYRWRRY